jgi:hypothetical protein
MTAEVDDDGNTNDIAAREALGTLVSDVDRAIGSPHWWAWLCMLEVVCNVLRKATEWTESCSCHHAFLSDPLLHVSIELRKQWASCPMRGISCHNILYSRIEAHILF